MELRSELVKTSMFIALILRHKPEVIGITLDEHGWADVAQLIDGVQKKYPFDMGILEEIVEYNNKKRFVFNADKTKIRANQGHSVHVDVELEEAVPPEILYHGTREKYLISILEQGLLPQSRLHVHLSPDWDTAVNVGSRRGKPVVFQVNSGQMYRDGFIFYKSLNCVWLIDCIPVKYMSQFKTEH